MPDYDETSIFNKIYCELNDCLLYKYASEGWEVIHLEDLYHLFISPLNENSHTENSSHKLNEISNKI